MHPWHDPYIDESLLETAFPVVIEIPKGSKNKYELDKETGLLRLDRVLHSAVYYPADYGFIPRTFCDDGDPLDAMVLSQEPVYPLTIVQARAIGVMRMRDEKGVDDKIVAVSVRDPAVSDYRDQAQLPPLSIGFVSLIGFALMAPVSSITAAWGARMAHTLSRRALEIAFGLFLLAAALRFLASLVW